jgi:RNA methyltransferase, TrmH family
MTGYDQRHGRNDRGRGSLSRLQPRRFSSVMSNAFRSRIVPYGVRRIASRQNPIVARFRAAARGETDGAMLLDGLHLLTDALDAGIRLREAAVAADDADRPELRGIVARLEREGVETSVAVAPVMAALSPVRSSSAVVAIADRPAPLVPGADTAPILVIAIDVQDPGNIGAIIRVAEAGGASGVVAAGSSADPFGWKALRGSMGSTLRLPVAIRKGAYPFAALRSLGYRVVATSPRSGQSLFDANLAGPVALIIGGEGSGLSVEQLQQADEVITIPMQTPVESLNAAVTAALLVYEARRRRS